MASIEKQIETQLATLISAIEDQSVTAQVYQPGTEYTGSLHIIVNALPYKTDFMDEEGEPLGITVSVDINIKAAIADSLTAADDLSVVIREFISDVVPGSLTLTDYTADTIVVADPIESADSTHITINNPIKVHLTKGI